MKKVFALLLAIVLLGVLCGVMAEEAPNPQIKGEIEDGCYVLTVQLDPDDAGEWRADEVKPEEGAPSALLISTDTKDGVFTARIEAREDGDVSVMLRHYNGHACDEMHTFDLRLKDGKVAEETGGSYTASPDEADLDPVISGKWLEKETQFTTLEVTKNSEGGWDLVITSPVSHEAWVIRATVYYDCEYDAFIYESGTRYNLIPGDETKEEEAATTLGGSVKFVDNEGNLELFWTAWDSADDEGVTFEKAAE